MNRRIFFREQRPRSRSVVPNARRPSVRRRTRAAGRDESGLIALEWIVIFGSVAALSAAVVLVARDAAESTTETISSGGSGPAAAIAASRITFDARAELPSAPDPVSTAAVNRLFSARCDRLEIAYIDHRIEVTWVDADPGDHEGLFAQNPNPPARAQCTVATRR